MKKSKAFDFIDKQPIIQLATLGLDGTPQVRSLINIRNPKVAPHLIPYFEQNDRLLMITNTHTDKIVQIRANNRASLYAFDNKFDGLLLIGTVTEVLDNETKGAIWDDSFIQYYPHGRDGGDFSVLEFMPRNYKAYANLVVEDGPITA